MKIAPPHNLSLYIGLILLMLLSGCGIDQKDIQPEQEFIKIYNHPDEQLAYYPESLLELEDGGFLFLAAVKDESAEIEYPTASLVRTSATGKMVWSRSYDWLAPAPRLIRSGNGFGFVAMDQQFEAHAVMVDVAGGDITAAHPLEVTMPLVAYQDQDEKLLVLGYDFVSRSSWIARFSDNFILERSVQLPVNTDLEYLIQRHLNRTGQDFPFFMGSYDYTGESGYYVNCFYNYTLRAMFLDHSSLGATGDIYSFQTEEGISSLIHQSENRFGLTSYYEGNNYMISGAAIDVHASQNIKDLPGSPLYELTQKAAVRAQNISVDGTAYTLMVSQTHSNALVCYQFLSDTDSLVSTHHVTFDERVEVADFIQTEDGGVTILASNHILGKYRRPVLVKMREEEFLVGE